MDDSTNLKIYKSNYEERKSEIEGIIKKIENVNAIQLIKDIIFQLDNYHGQHIHTIRWDKGKFSIDLRSIEKLKNPNLTIRDLIGVAPEVYYRFIGDSLYCIMTDYERGLDKLLKL